MTEERLYTILSEVGLPIAYASFKAGEKINLPYIVYKCDGADNFHADNVVFQKIQNYDIELYTENKDVLLEYKIEDIFMTYQICYEKYENYISSEDMLKITYQISELYG